MHAAGKQGEDLYCSGRGRGGEAQRRAAFTPRAKTKAMIDVMNRWNSAFCRCSQPSVQPSSGCALLNALFDFCLCISVGDFG